MWQRFRPYAPTAGFWLLAVAITVSGYQSLTAAAILGAAGAVCLLIPAWPWLARGLRPGQRTETSALSINVGDTDPYKVVNFSDGEIREFVRAIIRSTETFHQCRIELNRLSPRTDEADLYILNERFNILGNGDTAIDIAHLDIVEGRRSPIMLRPVSPSGTLHAIPLQRDKYVMRLSVSGGGKLLCEKNVRLWIHNGTLRLTPEPILP